MTRTALRRPEARMFAVSFLVLYLELAIIRWVTGYVHNFGYFTNFGMLAAFLGVGLGCLLAQRSQAITLLPGFLCGLALIIHLRGVEIDLPVASQSSVFWSEAVSGRGVSATIAVVGIFLLVALTFVGLGQAMGALFAQLPRLRAVAFNVGGALAGILLFAAHSWLAHPPIVWFATWTVVAIPFLAASPRWTWPLHALLMGGFLALVAAASRHDTWGPYYRQTLITRESGDVVLVGNGIPGIVMTPGLDEIGTFMYEAPYSGKTHALRRRPDAPIRRALVIGCGGGNDVASALRHGVEHVDAVDINPWVIAMGKAHHPQHPFDSDRVTTFVADGREFLARGGDKYDLIVYGLPDSTFTNDRSNLRVESFIFTLQAFQRVRERLSDDGIFVLYNYYRVPWLVAKIAGMLRVTFGQEPLVDVHGDVQAMVPATLMVGPGLALPPPVASDAPRPATDDWPFLYLSRPSVPSVYVAALAAVLGLSLLLVFDALRSARRVAMQQAARESPWLLGTLFLMGAAFTLLETRSVVTFGLLFGSTWWTNVVVFAAIHVSILGAVLVAVRFPDIPPAVIAAALLASLAMAWLLPPDALLLGSATTRAMAAGAVAFLPVFCANVLFASVFRTSREGRVSYAANLLGGMLGGLLEYSSLIVGYRMLVVLAAVLYGAAIGLALRFARTASDSEALDGPAPY